MREIPTPVLEPYRPRTIRFHGVREREDWRIKVYSISDEAAGWRPARSGESFCVWDLEVMWHERDAYVMILLTGRDGDRSEEYLSRYLGATAEAPRL